MPPTEVYETSVIHSDGRATDTTIRTLLRYHPIPSTASPILDYQLWQPWASQSISMAVKRPKSRPQTHVMVTNRRSKIHQCRKLVSMSRSAQMEKVYQNLQPEKGGEILNPEQLSLAAISG